MNRFDRPISTVRGSNWYFLWPLMAMRAQGIVERGTATIRSGPAIEALTMGHRAA